MDDRADAPGTRPILEPLPVFFFPYAESSCYSALVRLGRILILKVATTPLPKRIHHVQVRNKSIIEWLS